VLEFLFCFKLEFRPPDAGLCSSTDLIEALKIDLLATILYFLDTHVAPTVMKFDVLDYR